MARRCARAGTPTKIKNLCDHQWYDEEAKKVMVCAAFQHACGVACRLCSLFICVRALTAPRRDATWGCAEHQRSQGDVRDCALRGRPRHALLRRWGAGCLFLGVQQVCTTCVVARR
jgi:hypothetical protein